MHKTVLDELEFEKSKRDILKLNPNHKSDTTREYTRGETKQSVDKVPGYGQKRYAWEIELENYRKSKWKERFYFFGAICGILSLALTLFLNFDQVKSILMKFL